MVTIQFVSFAFFKIFLLTDGTLLDDIYFLQSIDLLWIGWAEMRFSHHKVEILLQTSSWHQNVVCLLKLNCSSSHWHVHVHAKDLRRSIWSWLGNNSSFKMEKRSIPKKIKRVWRIWLLSIVIVWCWCVRSSVAVGISSWTLINIVDFKRSRIIALVNSFYGFWLAVKAFGDRVGVLKLFIAVVAKVL